MGIELKPMTEVMRRKQQEAFERIRQEQAKALTLNDTFAARRYNQQVPRTDESNGSPKTTLAP
jgi:predicted extracellular nuclease